MQVIQDRMTWVLECVIYLVDILCLEWLLMNCCLQMINVSCERHHRILFRNLSFQVQRGEILLIEGANGSGKSSLIRLLTGLSLPASGSILWRDKSIQQIRDIYHNDLHYVGHTNGIKLGLTVLENLRLANVLLCESYAFYPESILALLQLDKQQYTLARYLSAGQKRRLAMARLFLFPKPLWILDEPFTALDKEVQTWLLAQLKHHVERGGIAIISSHHYLNFKDVPMQTLRLGTC